MLCGVNIIRLRASEHQPLALDSLNNNLFFYTNEYLGCKQADGTSIEPSQQGYNTALDRGVKLITCTSVKRKDPAESWGETPFIMKRSAKRRKYIGRLLVGKKQHYRLAIKVPRFLIISTEFQNIHPVIIKSKNSGIFARAPPFDLGK